MYFCKYSRIYLFPSVIISYAITASFPDSKIRFRFLFSKKCIRISVLFRFIKNGLLLPKWPDSRLVCTRCCKPDMGDHKLYLMSVQADRKQNVSCLWFWCTPSIRSGWSAVNPVFLAVFAIVQIAQRRRNSYISTAEWKNPSVFSPSGSPISDAILCIIMLQYRQLFLEYRDNIHWFLQKENTHYENILPKLL